MKISNLVASATAQTTPPRSHGMTCSAVPGPSWRKCNQRQKRNLLLIGGTGTGKTHPAIALGRNAARQGKRVSFYSVVDLVNQLEQEEGSRSAF